MLRMHPCGVSAKYIPPGGQILVDFSRFYPLPPQKIDPEFLHLLGEPEGVGDGEGEVRHCKCYLIACGE